MVTVTLKMADGNLVGHPLYVTKKRQTWQNREVLTRGTDAARALSGHLPGHLLPQLWFHMLWLFGDVPPVLVGDNSPERDAVLCLSFSTLR